MHEQRLIVILLAVIALALTGQLVMQLPWSAAVQAQPQDSRVQPLQPQYRNVIIDRYEDVATAEKNMQLRLLEGYEIIKFLALPESIGDPYHEDELRVSYLKLAPIQSSWVVVYGRK